MRRRGLPISRPYGWRYWLKRGAWDWFLMVLPYGMMVTLLLVVVGLPGAEGWA